MIAVSDLVGQGVNQSEANVVSEKLRAELYKTGRFHIIERSQMQEILKEQGFQQTGCTADSCAVQAGQLLGVDEMVVGTLGTAGSYMVLAIRIVDVQTGEVLATESVQTSGGVDKIIEGGIREAATNLVGGFSNAIIEAAKNGDVSKARKLLKLGVDVNSRDDVGWTPLHRASGQGNLDLVKLLVERGAYVNAVNNGWDTPLHIAALVGHLDVIKLLLKNHANVNAKNKDGQTPLQHAAGLGFLDVAKVLVENGADVRAKGDGDETPLHEAAQYGKTNMVEFLLRKGADVNAKSKVGMTPLHYAASCGSYAVAKVLIANGANPNAKDLNGMTPLKCALPDSSDQKDPLEEALGVDNRVSRNMGKAKIVKLLRENGATN